MLGWLDRIIDGVARAYGRKPDSGIVPRGVLRWSLFLALIVFIEFMFVASVLAVQGERLWAVGAVSMAMGLLGLYALWMVVSYGLVYLSRPGSVILRVIVYVTMIAAPLFLIVVGTYAVLLAVTGRWP